MFLWKKNSLFDSRVKMFNLITVIFDLDEYGGN